MNNMKKLGICMNILMGLCMSFVLSLVGTLSGGHFTVPSWLISFGISFVISLVIGFLVPIKLIGDKACQKIGVPEQSFKGTLVSAALSDLIYTPIITIVMVTVMLKMAAAHAPEGSVPPIPVVLVPSLLISLAVGFIVIAIIQPILIKSLMKKFGMNGGKRPENK